MKARLRRILALWRKESRQIVRDPSSVLIAFGLPILLLIVFGFGVSLDLDELKVAAVIESAPDDATKDLVESLVASPSFAPRIFSRRAAARDALIAGDVDAVIAFDGRFSAERMEGGLPAAIQVLTDGANPNEAALGENYVRGAWRKAQRIDEADARYPAEPAAARLEPRFWFNPELESRRFLVPGAVAIVMTVTGAFLTALVVAREWERGTMEALLSTPVGAIDLLIGKFGPYFALGLGAMTVCAIAGVTIFDVPFRGSPFALVALSSAFLLAGLGQGLLISTVAKNQFVASQIAVLSAFLPAFLLSGFIFEIRSMPGWIQIITAVIPARYFVSSLQTVFLVGDVWPVFLRDMAAMAAVGAVLIALTLRNTQTRIA